MALSKGTAVTIIGGANKGRSGEITAVRNSKRDGLFYMVEFLTDLRSTQVAAKFVKADISEVKSAPAVASAETPVYYAIEGKWVNVVPGAKVLEHSVADPTDEEDVYIHEFGLDKVTSGKLAFVTLVYEEDGELLANVVFQGMYAVVRVKDLESVPFGTKGRL